MNSGNKRIVIPKKFRPNCIVEFINSCSVVFKLENKKEKDFYLDLSNNKECSMVGVLLIYKFMEFSVKKKCFYEPSYNMSDDFEKHMKDYGFKELIEKCTKSKSVSEKEFNNLKVLQQKDFIIAPHALLRDEKYSSNKLNAEYYPKIQDYYSHCDKTAKMIFTCFSEILLNFWQHSVSDTQTVFVAKGNKKKIEIACVDNGDGVLTTLKRANIQKLDKKEDLYIFSSSVKKGVTSKSRSNHMGHGLWIIDQIIEKTGGEFHLYSEGYYYIRKRNKVMKNKCGYWKGTIIYLCIPLKDPVTISDIEDNTENNKIKVRWN